MASGEFIRAGGGDCLNAALTLYSKSTLSYKDTARCKGKPADIIDGLEVSEGVECPFVEFSDTLVWQGRGVEGILPSTEHPSFSRLMDLSLALLKET